MSVANTTIRIRKSLISGNVPSSLANGEIAINAADDKIFYAKPSGTISYITNQQTFATVNANSSLVLASSTTDTLTIVPGNNISISACTSTKTITITGLADGGSEKVFNYRQNVAPTSSNNIGDLWTNTDTGVVYENFGTVGTPIWAETGPTGITYNTAPGIIQTTNLIFSDGSSMLTAGSPAGYTQAAFNTANTASSNTVYLFGALNQTNTNITSANTQLKSYTDGLISYRSGVDATQNNNIQSAWNKANNALANATGIFAGDLTITSNTTIGKQLFINYTPPVGVNSAIEIASANTKGGAGYADFLKVTNTSGGTTNPNKFFRLNQTGGFEIVDSAYLNNLLVLTDAGDITNKGNTTINGIAPGYAPNRPAFRVYGANTTNALTTTQNGSGVLNYNNWAVDYNQGNYLNITTGVFTAPVAGLYQVNVVARNSGYAGGISQICAIKNSTIVIMVEWASSSTMNHTGGSTIVKLAVGDTLKLQITGGQVTFDSNDNWAVAYIG